MWAIAVAQVERHASLCPGRKFEGGADGKRDAIVADESVILCRRRRQVGDERQADGIIAQIEDFAFDDDAQIADARDAIGFVKWVFFRFEIGLLVEQNGQIKGNFCPAKERNRRIDIHENGVCDDGFRRSLVFDAFIHGDMGVVEIETTRDAPMLFVDHRAVCREVVARVRRWAPKLEVVGGNFFAEAFELAPREVIFV